MTTVLKNYLGFILILFSGCISDNQSVTDQLAVTHFKKTTAIDTEKKVVTLSDPIRNSDLTSMIEIQGSLIIPKKEGALRQKISRTSSDNIDTDQVLQKSTEIVNQKNQISQSTNIGKTDPENAAENIPKQSIAESAESLLLQEDLSPKIYRLKRGDRITISVFDEEDMNKTVSVLPDGNVNYVLIGNVRAINKTFGELADEIEKRLSTFYHDPRVNIDPDTLSRGSKHHVIIRGAVRYPGRYEIDTGDRIIEMIAATQGLLYGKDNTILADFSKCKLFRDGKGIDIDFESLLNGQDISDNIQLRDGDVIFLPPKSLTRTENIGFAKVLGAVVNPGLISLGSGDRILDVFIKSGGVEDNANWNKAYLKRGQKYHDINLDSILNEKDMTTNLEVLDDDFIYVPERNDKISIIGAVSNSGRYFVDEGDKILDMIAKAGGLLFRPDFSGDVLANLKASYILRDGNPLDVDFQDLLQGGVMKYNLIVKANDFIYIPEATLSQVYVFGEVSSPQAIPLTRELSLIDVLARAGDLTSTGKFTAQAAIFRGGVLDKRNVIIKDLTKLFKGDLGENIILQQGDIIYIPEVKISKFGRFTGFFTTWMEFITDIYDFQGTVRTGKSRF